MSMPAVSSKNNPTVYVIQDDPSRNLLPAMDYGNLESVLQPHEEVTMLNTRFITSVMKYRLRNMKRQDYLLLIGHPIAIGIACAIAAEITDGSFNVLKWDGQERRYWSATVDLAVPPMDAEMRRGSD